MPPDPDQKLDIDEKLLARLKSADHEAYAEVYRRFNRPLYTVAFRICQSEQEALDVLQETFVQAFVRIEQFRGDSFWGWIRRITVNQCLSRLRQIKRKSLTLVDPDDWAGHTSDGGAQIDLNEAFARLPAETRAVVWLYDVEGYSHQEIADAFGKSLSFSKTQLSRAHQKLRDWLDKPEDDGPCPQMITAS
ncbi:MAG: RNA polymerase sigma factor [Xanthomonadales bacterium]|nr:RNA polymerase sigma factor [Xanthomonadales bacterium]